ncbi:uncharacterized protein LOC128189773 isoform X1 [Crassostrea angulata]|uniref:uncharacterized protein LOC128189773 isoform X1 n=1 Tax=Magallana angulata TaxID=2784310 RepID=UPI0022B0CFA4|nr:uncharacterized protein LOC128189773 isoform X1 [Crassostrea angulata]XP_052717484.1 uncharacterized protein LOC128189773 isoform X1 [Crassostrea angulata]
MSLLPLLYLIPYVIGQMFSVHQDITASKNGSSGTFTSPGYPGNYPNNANYTWTLTTGDSNARVVINITDFSVVRYRFTSKCEDYLQVERTEPNYALISKRCGDFAPFNLECTGKIFVVTFVSDSIHNARGFYLSWQVYIPDTTTKRTTTTTREITTKPSTTTTEIHVTTTTKPTTSTTELTIKKTEERTTTETSKTTSSRTTTPNPRAKKSTREILTLPSALLTSNQKQPRTHTNGPFTKTTESYIVNEGANNQTATFNLREISMNLSMDKKLKLHSTLKGLSLYFQFLFKNLFLSAYLISAIVVIEVILTAIGIYFVKQRRINFRNPGCEEVNKIKTNPYSTSTLSRDCGHGNYEIIQLNEASNNHTLHQTGYNECTYIEVIEHEYDYTYGDIKPVSDNTV